MLLTVRCRTIDLGFMTPKVIPASGSAPCRHPQQCLRYYPPRGVDPIGRCPRCGTRLALVRVGVHISDVGVVGVILGDVGVPLSRVRKRLVEGGVGRGSLEAAGVSSRPGTRSRRLRRAAPGASPVGVSRAGRNEKENPHR